MDTELNLFDIPSPQKDIAAQNLLADGETTYHGYMKKLKSVTKGIGAKFNTFKDLLTPVRPILVIINKGCLYCFKDETGKKANRCYTLYGYNRIIRAVELQTEKRPWVFQVENVSPALDTLVFSTITQQDMEKWMVAIKKEMIFANRGSRVVESDRVPADGKDESLSDFVEQPIYDDLEVAEVAEKVNKDPSMMGKCTDDDDVEDQPNYLEFESSEHTKADKQGAISNELMKAFVKKTSRDETGKKCFKPFGSKPLPKVPPYLPSKSDFNGRKNTPLPSTPGELEERKRSDPDGKSFKRAEPESSPDKPKVALKPNWQKKTSSSEAPKLDPFAEEKPPELPAARKPRISVSEATPPVSPLKPKTSITLKDIEKDQSLYWKCHNFDGTKEEGQVILARLAQDGVYLVRDGANGNQVLAVFCNKRTHKYVIRYEDGIYSLGSGSESNCKAETMEQMLYHYHTNNLPNKESMLSQPYQIALLEENNT